MKNEKYNAKCIKCGYIYEADETSEKSECPLCGNLNPTKEAMDGFREKFKDYFPEKKSKGRAFLDILLLTGAFIAFIVVLYILIAYIAGLASA